MSMPVSVVMAVYNGRKYLVEQIESVLNQLEAEDELVVVDDASSDGSATFVRELNSPRIRLYVNPQNIGVLRTFERALRLARHDLIFLCDQDDIWLPGKRTAYVNAFENDSEVCIVISDAELIDGSGNLLSKSYMTSCRGGFDGSLLGTLWRNRYLGCAMAVRGSLLRIALPIPIRAPMHDMWLGALGRMFGRITYLSRPYQRYRRHGGNASPLGSDSWRRIVWWRLSLLELLLRRKLAVTLGWHKNSIST
jgi:glycosyltransferase involved in cell wall biosynthesis